MKKALLLFGVTLLLFLAATCTLDHYLFKKNKSFSVQMILSTLPACPAWTTPAPSWEEREQLLEIFSQNFHYLDRGGQSAVFASDDGEYVLKFYRFPSHLRPAGWLKHPFAYHFHTGRKEIKKHNAEKLKITFSSFLLASTHLKEESGLLFTHLNPTKELHLFVRIVDYLGSHYRVNLDQVAFLLQKRAEGIFPTLATLIKAGKPEEAKRHLKSLLHLLLVRCNKGIADLDALLEQNYGFSKERAIHIDVGRLALDETFKKKEKRKEHFHSVLWRLREWLKESAPELSLYFEESMEEMLSSNV